MESIHEQVDDLLESVWMPETEVAEPDIASEIANAPNVFAANLIKRMTEKGFTNQTLARAVTARGNVALDPRLIATWRSAGIKEYGTSRKAEELSEIAVVLECTVAFLFGIEPSPKQEAPDEEETIKRCKVALAGPRNQFLIEAIDFAYGVAITSQPRQR